MHTQTKWEFKEGDPTVHNGYKVFRFANFSGCFQQWAHDGNCHDNANLIITAAELLFELKCITRLLQADGRYKPSLESALKVIDKAEGRA